MIIRQCSIINAQQYITVIFSLYFPIFGIAVSNALYFGDDLLRFARPSDLSPTHTATEASAEFAIQRTPDAIIIGAKKSGTRALLEFLRLNPRIQAPGPEVHFFDKHFHEGFDWYRKQMPLISEDQVVLEKSPSYFVGKHVPERVHSLNPAMKLILVVRDPITRAISDYTQTHATRHNSTIGRQTFEELVSCEPFTQRHRGQYAHSHCVDHINTSVGPIRIGIYHKHLENWLRYFPLHQIHIMNGERLISDPASELRTVEKFLGLQPVITAANFVLNKRKGFQCVRRGHNLPHCLPDSKGRPHAPIDAVVLERLRRFYSAENEKFFQLINRRFHWTA